MASNRAMPHWSTAPNGHAPTSTILPSGCSTSLRPKLFPVDPGKRVVTTPLIPNEGSRTPLLEPHQQEVEAEAAVTLVRPPTMILPSGLNRRSSCRDRCDRSTFGERELRDAVGAEGRVGRPVRR